MSSVRLLLNLLIFSLVGGILSSWLLTTQSGSRWVIELTNQYTPVTVSGVSGSIVDGLRLNEILLRDSESNQLIKLSGVNLEVDLRSILEKEVLIKMIAIETFIIDLPESQQNDSPGTIELPDLELPWNITLHRLSIDEVLINQKGLNRPHRIQNIRLSAAFIKDQLNISDLSFQYQKTTANMKGDIKFQKPHPINLTAFVNQTDLQLKNELHLTGEIDNYSLSVTINNNNKAFPFRTASIESLGNLTSLNDINGQVITAVGDISITGQVNFYGDISAGLILTGRHLNPAGLRKPGQSRVLEGDINLSTSLTYRDSRLEIKSGLEGKMNDYQLSLDLISNWQDNWLTIERAVLENEKNIVKIIGKANTSNMKVALEWDINSPELHTLYPDLNGEMNGFGLINYDGEAVTGNGDFEVLNLKYNDYSIESMQILLDNNKQGGTPLDTDKKQSLSIKANQIKSGHLQIETASILGFGDLENHQFDVKVNSSSVANADVHVNGSFVDRNWNGTVNNLDIRSKSFGHYQQKINSKISFSTNKTDMSPLCIERNKEKVCASLSFRRPSTTETSGGSIQITMSDFPVSRFSHWLPQTSVIKDKLDVKLDMVNEKKSWVVKATARIDANNYLALDNLSFEDAAFKDGTVDINFDKMVWLTLFSDSVLKPQGHIKGTLTPRGPFSDPVIKGEIQLINGRFLLPETGTEINDIETKIVLVNLFEAIILGKASSGSGGINFSGKAAWRNAFDLTLSVGGKDFLVMNSPGIKATASPDLTLVIAPDPANGSSNTRLSGRILLPKIEVSVLTPPGSTVSVSEDEVIIDQPEVVNKKKNTFVTDIELILGNNVSIRGEGADLEVSGNVKLIKTQNLPIQTFGKIIIDKGTYQAYGQDLSIRKGEIYLAGLPDNPGLAIEAVRELKNITAGLQIRGTLKEPITTVFSEPALPETEALSYLLTGRSLTETSSSDNNVLLNAITKFGIKGSAGFVENLRTTTGLSALELQAGDDSTETSILVGKYLTPSLYIQYVKRLFDNQDTASMRYEISPHLSLEAESGSSQGLDLIYEIETD